MGADTVGYKCHSSWHLRFVRQLQGHRPGALEGGTPPHPCNALPSCLAIDCWPCLFCHGTFPRRLHWLCLIRLLDQLTHVCRSVFVLHTPVVSRTAAELIPILVEQLHGAWMRISKDELAAECLASLVHFRNASLSSAAASQLPPTGTAPSLAVQPSDALLLTFARYFRTVYGFRSLASPAKSAQIQMRMCRQLSTDVCSRAFASDSKIGRRQGESSLWGS